LGGFDIENVYINFI